MERRNAALSDSFANVNILHTDFFKASAAGKELWNALLWSDQAPGENLGSGDVGEADGDPRTGGVVEAEGQRQHDAGENRGMQLQEEGAALLGPEWWREKVGEDLTGKCSQNVGGVMSRFQSTSS
jgi:hypothetical protein